MTTNTPIWTDYVLNVTHEPYSFHPFCDEEVVIGMEMIYEKCPGNLVGVIHEDGQDAVNDWCAHNPDWFNCYSK